MTAKKSFTVLFGSVLMLSVSFGPSARPNGEEVNHDLLQVSLPFSHDDRSFNEDTKTRLERLNGDRILAAQKRAKKEMRYAKGWARGVTLTSVALPVALTALLTQWKGGLQGGKACDEKGKPLVGNDLSEREKHSKILKNERGPGAAAKDTIYRGGALAALYTIATIFSPVVGIARDSTGDALRLWWYGYDERFIQETRLFEEELRELRKALNQARRVQENFEKNHHGLHSKREDLPSTYYRDEIIVLYQRSIGRIERIIALMHLMAPKENHEKINEEVARSAHIIHRFADSLERDLNDHSRGFLTHYSNETLDLFHVFYENIRPLISNFKVFWRH